MPPHISRALRLTLLLHVCWSSVQATDSFLADTLVTKDQVQNVLEHTTVKEPACRRIPTGPIETTKCDYETVESVSDDLYSNLHDLVSKPFFRFFRTDLYRDCPFWPDDGQCMNRECGITTVDESEVPEVWRAAALSKIELPAAHQDANLPGCYYRDSDFCFLDDTTAEGEYFDLSLVPERFTGYAGVSANRVWGSIYQENCFGLSEYNLRTGESPAVSSPDSAFREDGDVDNGQCLEKRVYYKVVSGLHASISTHICADFLNQTTGEWGPNLECYVTKVASHPERLQYIYFNTVLLLRAVARIGPYLSAYDYCSTGTHEDDAETLAKLGNVISIAQTVGKFDESVLFRGEDANILKEEFKTHFRNVTRIMDCIGCDKCRLWGKVQTTGVATALKILFELDEKALDPHSNSNLLQRSEVVALINTLHRFSESIELAEEFRRMWAEASPAESARLIAEAEKAAAWPRPHPSLNPGSHSETLNLTLLERVSELMDKGIRLLGGMFKPSGKDQGPMGYTEL